MINVLCFVVVVAIVVVVVVIVVAVDVNSDVIGDIKPSRRRIGPTAPFRPIGWPSSYLKRTLGSNGIDYFPHVGRYSCHGVNRHCYRDGDRIPAHTNLSSHFTNNARGEFNVLILFVSSGSFGDCADTRRKRKMLEEEGVRFTNDKVIAYISAKV